VGGPLAFLRIAALAAAAVAGCAGPRPEGPAPEAALERPLAAYREVGMIAGPADFPAVAGTGIVAGPGDSAFVLVGLSLPNSALRFERDAASFRADYSVTLVFRAGEREIRRLTRHESVRVPGFAETARTDESVVFQEAVSLPPGQYELRVEAGRDHALPILTAVDTLDVPSWAADETRLGGPLLLHEGGGRTRRDVPPAVILNPRHTVSYGGERPILYVERYGAGGEDTLFVRVLDEAGAEVRRVELRIAAGAEAVRPGRLVLSADDLPLGRLWLEVSDAKGTATPRIPLIVGISDQWIVANFDDVLHFLRYIATPREVDALRTTDARERREGWEAFWARRDETPQTPVNEFRDRFFERIRHATARFAEPGLAGWRTHRGEVYVVFGEPDRVQDRYLGRTDRPNAIEWSYTELPGGPLVLLFVDRIGLGRFALSPASEASFRTRADRLKPRVD
jgi:GWxTD domain-containing protein